MHDFIITYPTERVPNIMKIHLIQHVVQMLNLTIQSNGVLDLHSPTTIVLGTVLDTNVHCRVEFGTDCQVHDEPSPLNAVSSPCTLDAIALLSTGQCPRRVLFISSVSRLGVVSWLGAPGPYFLCPNILSIFWLPKLLTRLLHMLVIFAMTIFISVE